MNAQRDLSFKCHTGKIKNIYQPDSNITHDFELSLIGYLDDTTWFSSSLKKLETKLEMAHSFYTMAKIKINVDKYKILTNQKLSTIERSIRFNINNKQIDIDIVPNNKGTRILGLHINSLDRHQQTIKKARSIIMAHVITMKNKKITHLHAIYIINKVILPKLEYILQHTILNYTQCQTLMAPLKKLFKHFFSLPLNTADNIIYNDTFPHINNLMDILVKSQLNSLLALFNTDTLRPIAIQKLDILTRELWYPGIPPNINQYLGKICSPSYLSKSLALIEQYQFHLDLTISYGITGGFTPIVDYLPDLSSKDYRSLRKKNIMYMDQLVTLDGNYLLTWDEVKRHNNNNFKGPKPKWFKYLENNMTLSNYRTLTFPLKDPYSIPKRLQKPPSKSFGQHKKINEWTYHWNASLQNCIIGKTIIQDTDTHSSITMMEHFIPLTNTIIDPLLINNSPGSLPLCLIPCSGCRLNDTIVTNHDLRIKCTINARTDRLATFNTFHHSSPEHKKFKNVINQKYYISTKSLHLIRHSAHSIFLAHHNIITPSITPNHTHLSSNNKTNSLKIIHSIIDSALLCDDNVKKSLRDLASIFSPFTNFQFYSDGSVLNVGSIESKSGFGWIQTHPSVPTTTFKGSTIFFPSSFKSENLAILTILITLPTNSICTIYTDSQNCIDTYNTRLTTPTISPRKRLKQNNFLIWDLIFWLIHHHSLTIQLLKVKAHSNNLFNDKADALAKEGRYSPNPIVINHKFFHRTSLGLINYNNIYVIDRSVRKWSNIPIQSKIFNMAMNNSSLLPISHQIKHGHIDWEYTKKWINHNPLNSPTSEKLKNLQSEKIKKSSFNYPTGNVLRRNYPDLYPEGRITCTECNLHEDTNALIGLCPQHRSNISQLLKKYKEKLIDLIKENNDSCFSFDIDSSINASNMFQLLPDVLDASLDMDLDSTNPPTVTTIPWEQPWLLLLHHLIPIDLVTFFYRYLSKKSDRDRLLIQYVNDFIKELTLITWSPRSRSFKNWEKSLDITPKKKKNYRRKRLKRRRDEVEIIPTLIVPLHRVKRNYARYYYNKTLPYFKHKVKHDDSACIRWTSCNFLHSGTWESYRDSLLFTFCHFLPDFPFLRSP
ncbi:unnamed protein product [Rhizophagus irregularis]|nr:unnamed protein product [Rhizophagus irregularis]